MMEEVIGQEGFIEHTWQVWMGAIFWTLIGIAAVKSVVFPYGQTSLKAWLTGRLVLDAVRGVLITLVVVRLGEMVIHLVDWIGWLDIEKLQPVFAKMSVDPIAVSLVIAIVVQIAIVRWRRKKTPGPQVYPGPQPPPQ